MICICPSDLQVLMYIIMVFIHNRIYDPFMLIWIPNSLIISIKFFIFLYLLDNFSNGIQSHLIPLGLCSLDVLTLHLKVQRNRILVWTTSYSYASVKGWFESLSFLNKKHCSYAIGYRNCHRAAINTICNFMCSKKKMCRLYNF